MDEMGRHEARMGGDEKCAQNLKGRDHLGDIGVHMRIILKWI
jgi:hypothetical protein